MKETGGIFFQAYQRALHTIEKLDNRQDKIYVWQMMVDFCQNSLEETDEIQDKNMVLFWCYRQLAELSLPDIDTSIKYYKKALIYVPDYYDCFLIYRKMADLYKKDGNVGAWMSIMKKLLRNKKEFSTVRKMVNLACKSKSKTVKKTYLRKAWLEAETCLLRQSRNFREKEKITDDEITILHHRSDENFATYDKR